MLLFYCSQSTNQGLKSEVERAKRTLGSDSEHAKQLASKNIELSASLRSLHDTLRKTEVMMLESSSMFVWRTRVVDIHQVIYFGVG